MKKRYFFLGILICIFFCFAIFYHNHSGYSRLLSLSEKTPYGTTSIKLIDNLFNEFDIIRSFQKNRLNVSLDSLN